MQGTKSEDGHEELMQEVRDQIVRIPSWNYTQPCGAKMGDGGQGFGSTAFSVKMRNWDQTKTILHDN